MGHELHTQPAPERLTEAFGVPVELRELSYGQLRAAIQEGTERDAITEVLLSHSLHVDGNPLGFDGLMALPGRFAADIAQAMRECMRMHRMGQPVPAEGDEAPKA